MARLLLPECCELRCMCGVLKMTDRVSAAMRSEIMRAVRSKNTAPELLVRKLIFSLGYRYRIHRKDLPGTPDIVFPGRKKVVFVHGCFWHGHCCKKGRLPKSRTDYWEQKIRLNKRRDALVCKRLRSGGWSVLKIWQCQLVDIDTVTTRLTRFLDAIEN